MAVIKYVTFITFMAVIFQNLIWRTQMAEATTTSGDIYTNKDNTSMLIREAEYDLSTRIHDASTQVKDRVTEDFIASTAQAERIAQTGTLANGLATQNLTAQANQIAATETLANSLAYQNSVAQANDVARQLTNLATTNATNAASQADRVAQAQVIASTLATNDIKTNSILVGDKIHNEVVWARDEARHAAQANVLASFETQKLIMAESTKTRDLINEQTIAALREKLNMEHQELVELRFDCKTRDRDFANLNNNLLQSNLTSQINAIGSQLQNYHQAATQGTVNFGSMSGNAGRNTSTNNIV